MIEFKTIQEGLQGKALINKLKKELFNMVYMWGRVGLSIDETSQSKVSENSPAFVAVLDKLMEAMQEEEATSE